MLVIRLYHYRYHSAWGGSLPHVRPPPPPKDSFHAPTMLWHGAVSPDGSVLAACGGRPLGLYGALAWVRAWDARTGRPVYSGEERLHFRLCAIGGGGSGFRRAGGQAAGVGCMLGEALQWTRMRRRGSTAPKSEVGSQDRGIRSTAHQAPLLVCIRTL